MYEIHARVPEPLMQAAREAPDVPAGIRPAELVRLALARLARWPDSAVREVTKRRRAPE